MGRDVLVVEDETGLLKLLDVSLKAAGRHPYCAGSVSQAEKILAGHPKPGDLILVVDIALRNESGMDLAISVAKRFPTVRILFMSAYVDELLLMDAGIPPEHLAFLGKPFTSEALVEAVDKLDAA